MDEKWYATADMLPPVGVVVPVRWNARPPFEAARVIHPRTRRLMWMTHAAGEPVFLPARTRPPDPARPWAGWHTLTGEHPELWRPLHPDLWSLQLPEPAWIDDGVSPPPRMWSSTVSYSAVEEAEMAELEAREMEEWREAAKGRARSGDDGEAETSERAIGGQWWRNPFDMTYSAAGSISPIEAEGRLMRAVAAERWIRLDRPGVKTFAGILAGLARMTPLSPAELAEQDADQALSEPSGRDWDDMLTALSWLRALGLPGGIRSDEYDGAVALLRWRAAEPPWTWRAIGQRIGRSHEGARQLYAAVIAEVARAANGETTDGGAEVALRFEALQAAGRAARLREREAP